MSQQGLERKEIDGLVFFKPQFKKEWVVSGVDICRLLGYKNPKKQAYKIYNKYRENFSETSYLLTLPRSEIKNGTPRVGTPILEKNEQEIRCYTRPGCWFFVAKCDIDKANKLIVGLFDAFDKLMRFLDSKSSADWKNSREQGKVGRRKMTDAIQQFIEYARSQGSEHADWYYTLFTKLEYSALFGLKGEVPKNFRNNLTQYELAVLHVLEIATDQELIELMDKGIPYKDIFKAEKELLIKRAMALIPKYTPSPTLIS